jgi:hypothetical protein
VICDPKSHPIEALQEWLDLIAGTGAYLSDTADALSSAYLPPSPLCSIGFAIERAAKIASILAGSVERELMHQAAPVKAMDEGGAA